MKKRDDYFRCKVCKGLYPDPEEPTDEERIKGFKCPKGCIEPFEQPPYESPLMSDAHTNN